ncbi:hypothetical protein AVEN_204286-1 [Araneus ventricosus]|uniref:Uncharacterized protein n=1 Tax=Araneus ventricosus TaxID=182803 RepID=A0A4Y2SR79_ARAVE|nr:hypothetical protein AVEN_37619-1 [Araneus ventricosus]GBN90402.1 hypothetical protein AVEN_204286-1 [Araneus ventricosus]
MSPAGVVRKFGGGPSQNRPRIALKRDINITKINRDAFTLIMELFKCLIKGKNRIRRKRLFKNRNCNVQDLSIKAAMKSELGFLITVMQQFHQGCIEKEE